MCVDVLAFYRIIFHFNAFNLFLYDNISISKLNIFLFSSRCIFFAHDCTNTFTISYIDVVCYAYVSISRQFPSFFIHRTISRYQNIFLYNIYNVCGLIVYEFSKKYSLVCYVLVGEYIRFR